MTLDEHVSAARRSSGAGMATLVAALRVDPALEKALQADPNLAATLHLDPAVIAAHRANQALVQTARARLATYAAMERFGRMESCWVSRTTRTILLAALAAASEKPGVPAGGTNV